MDINATLIGQTIAFAVFVWFCMKYVWPPLLAAIEERQQKIAAGLADAEKASNSLDMAKAEAVAKLKEAKTQASEIIDQANKRKHQILDEAKSEAVAEREKILAQAQAEIEAERNRASEELRKQVAILAVAGAEKILARSIDSAAHSDILDDVASKL